MAPLPNTQLQATKGLHDCTILLGSGGPLAPELYPLGDLLPAPLEHRRPLDTVGAASAVGLREVTKENLLAVLRLKVAPEQERFVAPNAVSIAQAYFDREIAWFRAIYADDTPVGFLMLEDCPESEHYFLWRFMIDARYQGLGFGARAMALLLDHLRTRPGGRELGVSCVPGEGNPGPFYEKLGFKYTGDVEDGELVMRRPIGGAA